MEQINNDSLAFATEQTNNISNKLENNPSELVSAIIGDENKTEKNVEEGASCPSNKNEKENSNELISFDVNGEEFVTTNKRLNFEDAKNFLQGKQLPDKYELDNLFKKYKEANPERPNDCGLVSAKNPGGLYCDMYWSGSENESDKQQAFIECFVYGMSFATDKNNSYRVIYKSLAA